MKYAIRLYVMMIAGLILVILTGCGESDITYKPHTPQCDVLEDEIGVAVVCNGETLVELDKEVIEEVECWIPPGQRRKQ